MSVKAYLWLVRTYLQPSESKWSRSRVIKNARVIKKTFEEVLASPERLKALAENLRCDIEYVRNLLAWPDLIGLQISYGHWDEPNYANPGSLVYYTTGRYV